MPPHFKLFAASYALVSLLIGGCSRSPNSNGAKPVAKAEPSVVVGVRSDKRPSSAGAMDAGADSSPVKTVLVEAGGDGGPCVVRITGVLEAQVYRGPGVDSPMRQETIRNLPPKTAARWRGRDHGMRHLACTYALTLNGAKYRYRHNAGQSVGRSSDLDPKTCSAKKTQAEVENSVREFTKQCSNLRAGEYWGYRLEPIKP